MKRLGLTLLWVFAASVICSAQTFYYPQIANGQNAGVIVITWLFVTNPNGSETATGSIQFTQDNGTPFNITFIDVDSNQLATTRNILTFENLSPGQTRIYLSTGTGPLQQGFGTLNSGVRVTSTALFSTYTSSGGPGNPGGIGAVYAEAGVAAVTSSLRQGVFFYAANNFDTGIALANPDPTNAATITLNIFDRNAIALSLPKVITLAPSNHLAIYVSQLYPNAVGLNGTVQIISSIPLAAACLRFAPSGAFTTLPVIPLASFLYPAWRWPEWHQGLMPFNVLAKYINGRSSGLVSRPTPEENVLPVLRLTNTSADVLALDNGHLIVFTTATSNLPISPAIRRAFIRV